MKYTLDWITKQNPGPTVAAFYSIFKNVTFQTYSGPQRIPLQAPLHSPALWTHANMSAHLLHSLFLKEAQCYRYVWICAIFPFPPLKPQHPLPGGSWASDTRHRTRQTRPAAISPNRRCTYKTRGQRPQDSSVISIPKPSQQIILQMPSTHHGTTFLIQRTHFNKEK